MVFRWVLFWIIFYIFKWFVTKLNYTWKDRVPVLSSLYMSRDAEHPALANRCRGCWCACEDPCSGLGSRAYHLAPEFSWGRGMVLVWITPGAHLQTKFTLASFSRKQKLLYSSWHAGKTQKRATRALQALPGASEEGEGKFSQGTTSSRDLVVHFAWRRNAHTCNYIPIP